MPGRIASGPRWGGISGRRRNIIPRPVWRGCNHWDVLLKSKPGWRSVEAHTAKVAIRVAKHRDAVRRSNINGILKQGLRGWRQISEPRTKQRLVAVRVYAAVSEDPLVEQGPVRPDDSIGLDDLRRRVEYLFQPVTVRSEQTAQRIHVSDPLLQTRTP